MELYANNLISKQGRNSRITFAKGKVYNRILNEAFKVQKKCKLSRKNIHIEVLVAWVYFKLVPKHRFFKRKIPRVIKPTV